MFAFPDYPKRLLSEDDLRSAYARGRAYLIFYLEESNTSHNHDLTSAIATANAHDISLDMDEQEYIELAVQEISYAEGLLESDDDFREKLKDLRLEATKVMKE